MKRKKLRIGLRMSDAIRYRKIVEYEKRISALESEVKNLRANMVAQENYESGK